MGASRDQAELLSTGQVARMLGVSRQHVVDLCDRGEMSFVMMGSHRRILRSAVEAILQPPLSRDQERSLWLHSVITSRLLLEPESTLDIARKNLEYLEQKHPDGMAARWLARWRQILDQGIDVVLETLTSRTPVAVDLRQNSPFAGVLTAEQRDRILAAFRGHWAREHAT